MNDLICEIIDGIKKEIEAVPVEKDGFYSPGSQMFVMGLYRAKGVVEKEAKEIEKGNEEWRSEK